MMQVQQHLLMDENARYSSAKIHRSVNWLELVFAFSPVFEYNLKLQLCWTTLVENKCDHKWQMIVLTGVEENIFALNSILIGNINAQAHT
jgi:hypothetical protein